MNSFVISETLVSFDGAIIIVIYLTSITVTQAQLNKSVKTVNATTQHLFLKCTKQYTEQ
jgi:hypothetical protein